MRANGFEVDILCPASFEQSDTRRAIGDPAVYRGLSAIARLFAARYDLIHCNIASLALIPIIRRGLNRIPLVETFHGFPQWWLEPKIVDKVAYMAEFGAVQAVSNFASSKTSVSNFVRSTLQQVLGIESSVVHNGITHCPFSEPTRDESRRMLKIEEGTIAVLFVGRLHPAKDPITLLRALEILVKQGRRVKLLIVGDGPLFETFHREVSKLGLGRAVISSRYLPSLHPVYSAADIFCFPSVNEAFGIVLLEAMDHSLPLLVSNSGAAPEVAGSGGITFRTGDQIDLSKKLIQLVDNPALREKLGREGRRRLEEHFMLDSMIKRYVRVYEETIGSRQTLV
jgi:glycosyltransferase involved in cell wall biosynthesis